MVGERAISQRIIAANGKFASLLRAHEEEEQLLRIGQVRIKEQAKEEAANRPTSGRSAWKISADFSVPLPRPGRPRAVDGMTSSFHFHCCSVTRSSPGTKAGAVAANHAAYVERVEAVEIASALDHAGYVERDDAVESADRALIFSNISDNPDRRRTYWEAVDRCERQGHAGLSIKAGAISEWLDAAAADLPPAFVAHCRAEQRRWAASRKKPKSFKPKRYRADEPGCAAILDVLRQAPSWPVDDPPVIFTPGAAGRTQYRYVAELPHELCASDRAAIVRDFCNHLGSFARDAEGRATGMIYTAVIHAPGPGNDRRNFHLHVIAHDRPAKWMSEPGKWDFEIAEEFKRKGETRVRYPHRQEKIVEVTRRNGGLDSGKMLLGFLLALFDRFTMRGATTHLGKGHDAMVERRLRTGPRLIAKTIVLPRQIPCLLKRMQHRAAFPHQSNALGRADDALRQRIILLLPCPEVAFSPAPLGQRGVLPAGSRIVAADHGRHARPLQRGGPGAEVHLGRLVDSECLVRPRIDPALDVPERQPVVADAGEAFPQVRHEGFAGDRGIIVVRPLVRGEAAAGRWRRQQNLWCHERRPWLTEHGQVWLVAEHAWAEDPGTSILLGPKRLQVASEPPRLYAHEMAAGFERADVFLAQIWGDL